MSGRSRIAGGFEQAAARYDAARPSYPDAAVDWLVSALAMGAGARVADLGAGTGKLSRLLRSRGLEVVAVEPSAAMRERLAEFETVEGTAEHTGLTDASVDAAAAAQAWHWFDGDAALREAARVLRPAGGLATIRNTMDTATPWVAEVRRVRNAYEPDDYPRYDRQGFVDAVRRAGGWTEPERRTFTYHQPTTREGVVDRVLSTSYIAALPEDTQAEVRAGVLAALADQPDELAMPYVTEVFVTRRTDS